MRGVILAYGILNAILYAGLLPLWDGFDEPFHYGYVQQISRHGTFPQPGLAVLSREVWVSLDFVPVAEGVHKNIPKAITFGEYFRLPPERRNDLRRRLEALDPRTGSIDSQTINYEAQQTPLAYLLLAPLDFLARSQSLLWRVLFLRLVCAVGAVLLTAWGMDRLGRRLGLAPVFAYAALFVVFSSQMFYAATAHITNDWLAVPLFTLLLAWCSANFRSASPPADGRPHNFQSSVFFAVLLAAALLTKAYFLALVPLALWIAIERRGALLGLALAAPWYVRNLMLYGNLSGMQETARGAPPGDLLHAALHLPWGRTLWSTAHSALFTGNNSYIAFSAATLTVMLALLGGAGLLYATGKIPAPERLVLAGMALMALGIFYSTIVAYWFSHGVASTPAPWYWQVLLPPGMILVMLGLSRRGRPGRWMAAAITVLWAYLIVATYALKLIPFYAGLSDGRSRMSDLPRWYGRLSLQNVTLLSTGCVLFLTVCVSLAAIAFTAVFVQKFVTQLSSCHPRHFEGN